jgi:hypothetical protein
LCNDFTEREKLALKCAKTFGGFVGEWSDIPYEQRYRWLAEADAVNTAANNLAKHVDQQVLRELLKSTMLEYK